MGESQSKTITWICDLCGQTVEDTFDPIDRWGMDHEDHDQIPRYWCSCELRDTEGRTYSGHFCSIAHMQEWIISQIPKLEAARVKEKERWDNTRVWRNENGKSVEAEKTPYPYPVIQSFKG